MQYNVIVLPVVMYRESKGPIDLLPVIALSPSAIRFQCDLLFVIYFLAMEDVKRGESHQN